MGKKSSYGKQYSKLSKLSSKSKKPIRSLKSPINKNKNKKKITVQECLAKNIIDGYYRYRHNYLW